MGNLWIVYMGNNRDDWSLGASTVSARCARRYTGPANLRELVDRPIAGQSKSTFRSIPRLQKTWEA